MLNVCLQHSIFHEALAEVRGLPLPDRLEAAGKIKDEGRVFVGWG
jgi:hypothetical protein